MANRKERILDGKIQPHMNACSNEHRKIEVNTYYARFLRNKSLISDHKRANNPLQLRKRASSRHNFAPHALKFCNFSSTLSGVPPCRAIWRSKILPCYPLKHSPKAKRDYEIPYCLVLSCAVQWYCLVIIVIKYKDYIGYYGIYRI